MEELDLPEFPIGRYEFKRYPEFEKPIRYELFVFPNELRLKFIISEKEFIGLIESRKLLYKKIEDEKE